MNTGVIKGFIANRVPVSSLTLGQIVSFDVNPTKLTDLRIMTESGVFSFDGKLQAVIGSTAQYYTVPPGTIVELVIGVGG